MQFTTVSILSALSALAAVEAHSDTIWHVTDLNAGCRSSSDCSYFFNIVGDKSDKSDFTPGFSAQCTARTQQLDDSPRPCTLVGSRKSGKYNVDEVNAYVSQTLSDERGSETHFDVEVKFNDGSAKYIYHAGKTQNYDDFVAAKNFDIYPIAEQGSAK
ncbi:unnamed protein product [Zymoseptoria tritici ST99CH_3D1]|uniref:Uncharacterized protein n=1 Tax=Zymoseptoria tritici (strain ST99CH_3D7) TaxID=1276538 RepID=A0A1X7RW59_ZYMT9|nr:unnamed protein product [Zymoseptoria tritici ST99CH_3D7]SMR56059.1 unnamed protein product [Zymoseptoria tritici ST99CH_3D1]